MATSESQKRASAKYISENLDEIKLRVPKGEKAIIKKYAQEQRESMNEYIVNSIKERMKRDSQ